MVEIWILIGVFGSLALFGALSGLGQIYGEKMALEWAFPPADTVSEGGIFSPIDEASKYGSVLDSKRGEDEIYYPDTQLDDNTLVYQQVVNQYENYIEPNRQPQYELYNTSDFSHSEITPEINKNLKILHNTFNEEINNAKEMGNISFLSENMKERIRELIGDTTSRLVTNVLTDLEENKLSVVMGLYDETDNTLSFEGAKLKISTSNSIDSGGDDYILLKGTLLPNGEFRVLHFDDAETVENGFGFEPFILPRAM